jgi:hypothetical protein
MNSLVIFSEKVVPPLNWRAVASDSYSSSKIRGAFIDFLTNFQPRHANVDRLQNSTNALTSQNDHLPTFWNDEQFAPQNNHSIFFLPIFSRLFLFIGVLPRFPL